MNLSTKSNSIRESAVESKRIKNKKHILRALYTDGKKSIAELSEMISISIPTLTAHIEELMDEKWIVGEEVDTKKQGRNPTIYSLNPSQNFILIIDVTIKETKTLLLNLRNETVYQKVFPLALTNDQHFRSELLTLVEEVVSEAEKLKRNIAAIGMASPGLINKRTGQNKTYDIFDSIDSPLLDIIPGQYGIPFYVLNDSKATALGEALYGAGKNKKNLLSVNVDWGVGLAVVIGGQIFNGAKGFAGELGHIQVHSDGELCRCGKIGCLDTVASASTLLNNVKKGLLNQKVTILSQFKDNLDSLTVEDVINAGKNGDGFAIDTLYEIGSELGKGLAIAVHLFNPTLIVVDGALSKADNLIINPIEFAINKYCLSDFKEDLTIKVTELGQSAKILGLNSFVIKKLFR